VLLALAALLVLTTSSRRDRSMAVGRLARETRKRDKSAATVERMEGTGEDESGGALVKANVLERMGGGKVRLAEPSAPPAPYMPVDEEKLAVTRRQFFNRGIVGVFGLGLTVFGVTNIAFLWPSLSAGFGSKIRVGGLQDILAQIRETREPFYVPEGRFYVVPYPSSALGEAEDVYSGGVLAGMEAGVVALYQKCVHLGCRVPWCKSSQWFECPCHGSKYNRAGEHKAGPAPRGLDRFGVEVSGGVVSVDTAAIIQGPTVGVDTTGQGAEGPFCA
jgi:cytochrome b6-f complex iron-sulfur subunit